MRLGVTLGLTRSGAGGEPPPPPGPTYADFVAHITELATGIPSQGVPGVIGWDSPFASGQGSASVGKFRTTAAAPAGTMYGTPWRQDAGYGWVWVGNSSACRAVQHGLPSEAVFLDQIASGRQIYYATSPGGAQLVYALSRNGYQSDGGTEVAAANITELIYWGGTQAMRMQPSLGLGPVPYTW